MIQKTKLITKFNIIVSIILIVLFSCDENDNFFDVQGNYPNDRYPTESFHNYTLKWVGIQSAHEDGFVTLINEQSIDVLLLDPTDYFGLGLSVKVRKDTDMSFYIAAIDSLVPIDLPNQCSLKYKKIPQGDGRFIFTSNIFWCEEEFGENGPDVYSPDIFSYDLISFRNYTTCDIEINPTNIPDSSKPPFYDTQGIRALDSFLVKGNDTDDPYAYDFRNIIHSQPNLQWDAEFNESCNDCTLRYKNGETNPEASPEYYFWCVEEYGEEGPSN